MVVCYGACLVILAALYVLNYRENIRRDKAAMETKQPEIENIEFADLTDFENPHFRYVLWAYSHDALAATRNKLKLSSM